MEEESAGWSVGAVVIVVLIALFVVIFIVVLISKGKWCATTPPPPCHEPPPPCHEPYHEVYSEPAPELEPVAYTVPSVDPFAVSIADSTHPRATASILRLEADGTLSSLPMGFLKPDENADSVIIGAAAANDKALYIYLVNKTMSGIYVYYFNCGPQQKWSYYISTGTSRYEAYHDLRGKLDTERANSVYSIYLEEDQLRLVTLAGVMDVSGQPISGETFLLRSGNYGLTPQGQLLEGHYPIRTPQDVTIEPVDPQQIVSFDQPGPYRYGYICRRQGQPGVALIGETRSWFVPASVEQFAVVGNFLVYLGADKQLYRQNLEGGLGASVQRLELPGTPSHLVMVGNLVCMSY